MKQLRKKALLPALSMALASVIALSGVTYAWFTTSPTASVTGMDVNVKAANGIQISLDARTWKSTISSADIKDFIDGRDAAVYPGAVNQFPDGSPISEGGEGIEIMPVSSAGNVVDGKLAMFYGEIDKQGKLTTTAEAEADRINGGNFIAFDLFINNTVDKDQPLKLDKVGDLSKVAASTAFNGNDNAKAETAVRVAFIYQGNVAAGNYKGAWDLNGGTSAVIWEPNSKIHPVGVVDANGDAPSTTSKTPYNGVKAAFTAKDLDKLSDAEVSAVETFDETKDIITLKPGINKVRIYIWLEGQDVDCVNQISYGDFVTNLSFSVPEIAEG